MAKIPSENYDRIIAALQRLGFSVIRQRGSHIRLQKQLPSRLIKITVPAHKPVKRSPLSRVLKQRKFLSMISSLRCRIKGLTKKSITPVIRPWTH